AEKVREPKHVAAAALTDDHRTAGARFKQSDAAQDECAHDPLAELRFSDQQRAELVGRDDQGLHGLTRHDVDQRRSARQLRQLAQEGARAVRDDQIAATGGAVLEDVGLAGQEDRQAGADGADRGQRLARHIAADRAEMPDPLDLWGLEQGEYLVAPRFKDRRLGHGWSRWFPGGDTARLAILAQTWGRALAESLQH